MEVFKFLGVAKLNTYENGTQLVLGWDVDSQS